MSETQHSRTALQSVVTGFNTVVQTLQGSQSTTTEPPHLTSAEQQDFDHLLNTIFDATTSATTKVKLLEDRQQEMAPKQKLQCYENLAPLKHSIAKDLNDKIARHLKTTAPQTKKTKFVISNNKLSNKIFDSDVTQPSDINIIVSLGVGNMMCIQPFYFKTLLTPKLAIVLKRQQECYYISLPSQLKDIWKDASSPEAQFASPFVTKTCMTDF